MFSKARRDSWTYPRRQSQSYAPPIVSPLQPDFASALRADPFATPSPSTPAADARLGQTAFDGQHAQRRQNRVGLDPPMLPPIPRIASKNSLYEASISDRGQSDDGNTSSRQRQPSARTQHSQLSSRPASPPVSPADPKTTPATETAAASGGARHFASGSGPTNVNGSAKSSAHSVATTNGNPSGSRTPAVPGLNLTTTPAAENPYAMGLDLGSSFTADDFHAMGASIGTLDGLGIGTSPGTLHDDSDETPHMEASVFPSRTKVKASSAIPLPDGPAMSRDFIDSRDRPYAQATARRPPVQSSVSSPSLLDSRPKPGSHPGYSPQRSQSPPAATPSPMRQLPQSRSSTAVTQNTPRSSSVAATNYSGSTARPSTHNSATSPSRSLSTIGTPFESTSQSFPLPQLVATRPKTGGASSTISGVQVPTHHSSSLRHSESTATAASKAEKRRTRLLHPMALLNKRRSGQDTLPLSEEERKALVLAQARQRTVASVGFEKLPDDFDPRIKGKIVHDFSAPRPPKRDLTTGGQSNRDSTFTSPPLPEEPGGHEGTAEPARPPPSKPSSIPSSHSRDRSNEHVPHLSDDQSSSKKRAASPAGVGAEHRGNKIFLTRLSQQSGTSTFSQESAVLPPFSHRSQLRDSSQLRDDDASWSSERDSAAVSSTRPDRESGVSSCSVVSPITGRSSGSVQSPGLGTMVLDDRVGLSPTAADFYRKGDPTDRPTSEVSKLSSGSEATRPRSQSESTARPFSVVLSAPTVDASPDVDALRPVGVPSVRSGERERGRSPALVPPSERSRDSPSPGLPSPSLDSGPSATPEPAFAKAASMKPPASPPRLVQKRGSAAGHAKRKSDGMDRRRSTASRASRFSFQLAADSIDEERALEDKFRVISSSGTIPGAPPAAADDDEDYFDENAIDDLDEMEMQLQSQTQALVPQALNSRVADAENGRKTPTNRAQHHSARSPSSGQMFGGDSDQESAYDGDIPDYVDERELTYAEHPSYRNLSALAHSRQSSYQSTILDSYLMSSPISPQKGDQTRRRGSSTSGSVRDGSGAVLQSADGMRTRSRSGSVGSATMQARTGFYQQPQAAGYGAVMAPLLEQSEANDQAVNNQPQGEATTASHAKETTAPTQPAEKTSNSFKGFRFDDSPTNTRSVSMSNIAGRGRADSETEVKPRWSRTSALWKQFGQGPTDMMGPSRQTTAPPLPTMQKDSAVYRGTVGKGFRATGSAADLHRPKSAFYVRDAHGREHDEMYFDDGGFAQEKTPAPQGKVDEEALDRLDIPGAADRRFAADQQRVASAMALNSTGPDGPYPSFALPNAAAAKQRDSALLLEDLPLMMPVDPKLIPQRNPSEDAKRLGRSSRVPPLPVVGGGEDEKKMQRSLQLYHHALADAANRAAVEGRFTRQSSSTTSKSANSASSAGKHDGNDHATDEHASEQAIPSVGAAETDTRATAPAIRPPFASSALNFDFGFDRVENEDNDWTHGNGNEDDIVAAANAEALANDSEGFYGSEFGFFAKARPGSEGELDAVNGGFFGEDGDNGLTRRRSTKEPELTPITERSEFSTRNSFIGLNFPGAPSAAAAGSATLSSPALAHMSVSPLGDNEVRSFEQLRRLRQNAFGGSNGSLSSSGRSRGSPTTQYVATYIPTGGSPRPPAYSTGSSAGSSDRGGSGVQDSPQRVYATAWQPDSPKSAAGFASGGGGNATAPAVAKEGSPNSLNAPRKHVSAAVQQEPAAGRKTSTPPAPAPTPALTNGTHQTLAGKESGAESVTYVREQENGQPRWVLERRRTSQLGQLELVGREVVQGGWI